MHPRADIVYYRHKWKVYPDVRVDDAVILVYHMFEAKMHIFHRGSVTSMGNPFLPGFQKFSCLKVRYKSFGQLPEPVLAQTSSYQTRVFVGVQTSDS